MTDEQKTTQAEAHSPFQGMPFMAMMQKMMGQQGQGCNCTEMMSQMMTMCGCQTPQKPEEKPAAEAAQQA